MWLTGTALSKHLKMLQTKSSSVSFTVGFRILLQIRSGPVVCELFKNFFTVSWLFKKRNFNNYTVSIAWKKHPEVDYFIWKIFSSGNEMTVKTISKSVIIITEIIMILYFILLGLGDRKQSDFVASTEDWMNPLQNLLESPRVLLLLFLLFLLCYMCISIYIVYFCLSISLGFSVYCWLSLFLCVCYNQNSLFGNVAPDGVWYFMSQCIIISLLPSHWVLLLWRARQQVDAFEADSNDHKMFLLTSFIIGFLIIFFFPP